ncbi:MAG: SDR family oxidoreductase [Chloroflexota bacterium]|nr:SDR family oxidoreductase [Chloroflexota bacterium]
MNSTSQVLQEDALRGRVCLITGASRALGAAIARRMATYGADVIVNYHRSHEAASTLCAELEAMGVRALPIQADVTCPEEAKHLVVETRQQMGRADILVNNVGPYADRPFLELSLNDFDRVLAGNVRATFMLSRLVGCSMKEQGGGQIINIAATDLYHRSHSVYGLAKAGIQYLTEAMALELAPEVQVFALAPDLIGDNEDMSSDELVQRSIAATPMNRLVTRSEIAEMVCLLCAPAFAMATGHTFVLDGGRSIPRIAAGDSGGV